MQYREFQNYHGIVHVSGGDAVTKTSLGLDCKGMEQVNIVLHTGTMIATATLNVKIEESDDNSIWSDLTNAVFAEKVAADDDKIFYGKIKVNTNGVKRYLRINSVAAVAVAEHGAVMFSSNLSGHIPVTVNALPTPEFSLNDVSA